jgi:hypothetical protein
MDDQPESIQKLKGGAVAGAPGVNVTVNPFNGIESLAIKSESQASTSESIQWN